MDSSTMTVAAVNGGDGADIQMRTAISLTNQSFIGVTTFADFTNTAVASLSAPSVSVAGSSSITNVGSGAVNAGNLSVTAEHFELTEGGRLDANTVDAGNGGDISVVATDIVIRDLQSGIGASAADIGNGGNIHLVAQNLILGAGGTVQAVASGPGAGGSVRIDAANVSITGGSSLQTGITADSLGGNGPAGSVRMNVRNSLTIAGGAQVSSDTFGPGAGGDVIIAAQNVTVDGQGLAAFTAISTETQNATLGGQGGNITLNIVDTVQLLGGGEVTASTFGPGAGGSVVINAARVFISGNGAAFFPGINASTENQTSGGRGGDIQLNLSSGLEIVDGGQIAVSTSGPGAGGSINISAPSVSISGDGSSIAAQTLAGLNAGDGGNIAVNTDLLQGGPGGQITASTAGSGTGGSIDITAHRLVLNNFVISADTTSPDTVPVPVTISQLNVSLDIDHSLDQNLDVALVGPDGTFVDLFNGVGGTGQNFRNTVLADDAPTSIAAGSAPFTGRFQPLNPLAAFDGKGFNGLWVLILTDPTLSDTGLLKSWSLSTGSITVSATDVPKTLPNPDGSINNVSFLTVDLPPAGFVPIVAGKGGDVRIHAGSVSLLNGARISAASANPDGSGKGGDVLVVAKDLNITGATGVETGISAKSFGAGPSGSVELQVGNLSLDTNAFVGSSNTGSGEAGSVLVQTDHGITVRDNSLITTSSTLANAGSIDITAGGVVRLIDQSNITASAGSNGGNIEITAPDLIYLLHSAITATAGSSGGSGTGGNITLDPISIVLNNSLISANATIGQGGNIGLISNFLFNSNSLITATGTTNGTINITAPALDLGAELITLPSSLVSAASRLQERCTALLQGDFSSFISIGRGGTEPEPDELESGF
jgi:large exoprotein involved in heme utilization and adhesion